MKRSVSVLTKIGSGSLVAGVACVVVFLGKLTVSADTLSTGETFTPFQYVFVAAIALIVLAAVLFVIATILSSSN